MTAAVLFVATRIVANPVSNVFQKRLAQHEVSPVFVIAVTHAGLTMVAVPLLPMLPLTQLPVAFWLDISVSATLAVAGNALLVLALKHSDLSILGSINAYKALLGLLLGTVLIGEVPTASGLAGVALLLIGSALVADRPEGQPTRHALVLFFRERGVQLRFAALACSATEAVFLKRAVLESSAVAVFCLWGVLGAIVAAALVAIALRPALASQKALLRLHWRTFGWLVITTGVMQLTTLLTFAVMQVGYSLALFQLSTLISVFLGYRYFSERHIGRRLLGSLVMIAGAIVIATRGAPS